MNIQKTFFKNSRRALLKSAIALMLAGCFYLSFLPGNASAFFVNSSIVADKPENNEDENFDRIFREGRDLIDKGDWAKAAEKFSEVTAKYPENKSVDAALYWLAFCYKKQRNYEKMGTTIDRLFKDYPSSSWTSDARVLLVEVTSPSRISGTGGQNTTITVTGTASPSIAATSASGQGSYAYSLFSDTYAAASKTPLDRQDEIKLAAFRSLLSADYQKGIQAMNDILKADSKASQTLKIEVLRTLRRPRMMMSYSTYPTALEAAKISTVSSTTQSQYTSALGEPLVKIFQNESNTEIRKEIIYTLAGLKTSQSGDYLSQLYKSENDKEIKKAIINGLGSSWNGLSGFYNTIATSVSSARSPAAVSMSIADSSSATAAEFAKLAEIFRTENDPELRRLALSTLQRFAGWQKNTQIGESLIQSYDSEMDENTKCSIIQSLAGIKQPQATKKLLDIAKNDKSDKLKLEAVYALGRSNDPEALKYLEEILK